MKKIKMKNPIKVNISLMKCWSFKDFKPLAAQIYIVYSIT